MDVNDQCTTIIRMNVLQGFLRFFTIWKIELTKFWKTLFDVGVFE